MSSDSTFKIWVWDGTSSWVEIRRFYGLDVSLGVNSIDYAQFTAFVRRDSTIVDYFVPYNPLRLTLLDSTDGTDGTIVVTMFLNEPANDPKTAKNGAPPVIWSLSAVGPEGLLADAEFDPPTISHPQFPTAEVVDTIPSYIDPVGSVSDIIDVLLDSVTPGSINNRTANSIIKGTIENTSNTHRVKFRQGSIYESVLDLAMLGDISSQFQHYLIVDTDASLRPRLNLISPVSSTYVLPNGTTGFKTNNPITGAITHFGQTANSTSDGLANDELRILDEGTECTVVNVFDDADRVINSVSVKWQGFGTGNLTAPETENRQQSTNFSVATNANSVSHFGRQEAELYAPWIQNASTAQTYAKTTVNMFKGTEDYQGFGYAGTAAEYVGVRRAMVQLRDSAFRSEYFDANLGDTVAVRDKNGDQVISGKYLTYHYSQESQQATITVGIPKPVSDSRIARRNREVRQMLDSMEITTFIGQETLLPPRDTGDLIYSAEGGLTLTGATTDTATLNNTLALGEGTLADGYLVIVNVNADDDVKLSSNPATDFRYAGSEMVFGPLTLSIKLNYSGSGSPKTIAVIPIQEIGRTVLEYRAAFPFPLDPASDVGITSSSVTITRDVNTRLSSSAAYQTGTVDVSVDVYKADLATIDLSHIHYQ